MPAIPRLPRRRRMTSLARLRRHLQQFGPYLSVILLTVPFAFAEPVKIVALYVIGKGSWLTGAAMLITAYAISIYIVERLISGSQTEDDDHPMVRHTVELVCQNARRCLELVLPSEQRSIQISTEAVMAKAINAVRSLSDCFCARLPFGPSKWRARLVGLPAVMIL